jgi:hypothetical protein
MSNNNKNLLSQETSPYLLQHANNPVHWHSWNKGSLLLAKQENKPILLSIGYSACHWCHVMAHESFEDIETARVMNELFINIKVDKEERPDLDIIYQNAHSLLTERPGGWPLTVFLSPETQMPIFVGTYFPKQAKQGLPAFQSLLHRISEIWQSRQSDILQQSASLQSTYHRIYESSKPINVEFNYAPIDIARNQIEKQFDPVNGGFSGAPKFPHPSIIEFSIKHWFHAQKNLQTDPRILHCALYTLEKMANGGVFDHLGGGFYRYSTDELWMIPHFEKMLYDNGPLVSLYSQAWRIKPDCLFFDAATKTANWAIREMQSPEGGYYSAQDADSEGHEGQFFVWSNAEINMFLENLTRQGDISITDIAHFKERFGLNLEANFEGAWHLHGYLSETMLANKHSISKKELHNRLQQIRQWLFQQREHRLRPDIDTKILCAWNGLMIHGMAVAGRLLEQPQYTESAKRAACYLKNVCWKNNRLFASVKDGKASLNAYVDDYAFLIYGLLELLQNQWDNELYRWALQLADKLLSDFEDANYGGFYFTSHQHEDLIQHVKSFSDDAIPAGNAIAALALNRLGYLSGIPRYIDAAKNCLRSAWNAINQAPISHCALLNALREHLTPPNILIIRDPIIEHVNNQVDNEKNWQQVTQQYYLPDTLVYTIPNDQTPHPSLAEKVSGEKNTAIAYPCHGFLCHDPIKNLPELKTWLENNSYRVLE